MVAEKDAVMLSRRVLNSGLGGIVLAAAGEAAGAKLTAAPARNVVLVHGAFADGSSWAGVVAILQRQGLRATAVQIPLTALADDVAVTRRALARQDGPTVLVGHSYGGAVISEAGDAASVSALVYVAALAPDAGEPFEDLAKRFPAAPGNASLVVKNGFAQLDEAGFVTHFAQDLPPERAKVLAATQGPIGPKLFGEPTHTAAWRTKPCWYAVSTMDHMVPPEMQRFLAQRMAATTTELTSSHASPLSQPEALAKLIAAAAVGAPG